MSAFGSQGFTLLAWVNWSQDELAELTAEDMIAKEKEWLQDASILWGTRWSMDFSFHTIDGVTYIFSVQARFTVSEATLSRALGGLGAHISFHRGGPHSTWEELVRYQACKQKWRVPEKVSDPGSGEGYQEATPGLSWGKRKK